MLSLLPTGTVIVDLILLFRSSYVYLRELETYMKQADQARAQRLLRIRREGARFRRSYFLRSPRFWLSLVWVACGVGYTMVSDAGVMVNRVIWLLTGVFVGRCLRDWIWLRDVVHAFPFSEKVVDWDKVQSLASETDSLNKKDLPS